jgi:CBS domain containing-hemolysin-like protein
MSTAKMSRLPTFRADVDDVTGVLLAKSLLRYAELDAGGDDAEGADGGAAGEGGAGPRARAALRRTRVRDDPGLERPYFVPESMSVWAALENMRRRRCHLAVVVDE